MIGAWMITALISTISLGALPAQAGCNPCICGQGGGLPPPPDCPSLPRPGVTALKALKALDAPVATTATGIPIDTEWKRKTYEFALKNVVHPSWGIAHSERDYQVALEIARREGFTADTDALFAAAFLHDLGGIGEFAKPDVDHAVRSVEVIEPLLREWGFPGEKWATVKEIILGHTYYGPAPASPLALAFRDADILDFLGDIGIARIYAITQEPGRASVTLKGTTGILRGFLKDLPGKLHFNASRQLGEKRVAELSAFLGSLEAATWKGAAL